MTPLARLLAERIRETGPITVADYMAECLLHPVHGYYTTRDPFGAAGDFTTAPEISQMFGELLGLALAQAWLDRGSPAPFTLAELGPGRGTLMADILRATKGVLGFHAAAQVVLVEASPHLRKVQAVTLSGHAPRWCDRVEDLPEAPLFLIANEYLDALPIRQFQRGPDGWQERLVGLRDGALTFGLSALLPEVPDTVAFRDAPDAAPGQVHPDRHSRRRCDGRGVSRNRSAHRPRGRAQDHPKGLARHTGGQSLGRAALSQRSACGGPPVAPGHRADLRVR